MAGQYTYDTTGQSYFFVLTVLLIILIPFTYSVLRGGADRAAARVPYPCAGWNAKAPEVAKISKTRGVLSKSHILLAVGWVAFAFVVQKASGIEGAGLTYDPFKILGISTSATEKEIKKHYKRMSLKFHPDKLTLAVNQTKEDADNHFVELTKAYKALTDEDIRKNFEMFGHPDGKQDFSQGIALPSWVVESKNIWYVMGAYALVLGVMLPYFVGRWWYGSRKLTKDGVLNSTSAIYFHNLKEETTFPGLLDILASSDEFLTDPALLKQRKAIGKKGTDEYARVVSIVRESADGKDGWQGYANWATGKKRARVLLAAHMLRVPIADMALLREKHATVTMTLPLTVGLASVALSFNWLSTYISIIHLQQFIIQAVHPSSSPLLQLPHVTEEIAKMAVSAGVETIAEFGQLGAGEVEKLLVGFRESEKREAFEVAKHWPIAEFTDAKFKVQINSVVGEQIVTPGAIVSFTVKLSIVPPRMLHDRVRANGAEEDASALPDGESTIDELIGRRKPGEDGEEPTPLAHAPYFGKNRKPTWYLFVGDHKLNRIFVAPHKFTDVGTNSVRTIRMTFQAPPGPGLYTFQAYIMCDSFVGTDVQKDMRVRVNSFFLRAAEKSLTLSSLEQMQVEPPPTGEEVDDDEDDISEPDEDTIAGQMAMMKGQPVRRVARDSEDDTSGTDDDEDDFSSSDSDSD